METPTLKAIMAAAPVSKSYAAVIRNGKTCPLNLAAMVYCETGWRHPVTEELSDETLRDIAAKQPWTPPKDRAA